MVGFKELLHRLQIQEQMTKQHQTRVDVSISNGFLKRFCSVKDGVNRCPALLPRVSSSAVTQTAARGRAEQFLIQMHISMNKIWILRMES